ncbi:MAG: DNA-binding response regulator [Bacteroidetes bacterium]|nr:MAG: DNA-binding response regulator [Bacteroidota bacterium]
MENPLRILIVEDEMVIGANISLQLSRFGYEVTGIVPRGEEALVHVRENQPDIVLLDINLKGNIDGIQTAELMQKEHDIPVIYLTANADDAHFNRAKATHPYAFISKPYKSLDLKRAIELTASRLQSASQAETHSTVENPSSKDKSSFILTDSIYVRNHDKMVKIIVKDIFYIEAERNYCRIFSRDKEYLLVMTLKDLSEKLPQGHFVRVHRSYIVNVEHVDEVAISHVAVAKKAIPLSKSYRDDLLRVLQTI